MDNSPLVSIIVPVWNVEKYIERCVNSVIRQTYRKLEIIIVDDCTPDHSIELAKACIAASSHCQDLQFVFLKHERCRGLSAARNTGIDAATGDYIYFLDSDDEITPNCIGTLVEFLHKRQYDFIVADSKRVGTTWTPHYSTCPHELFNEDIIQAYKNVAYYGNAWNKLCNLQFIRKNKLFFVEGLVNEDELWTFQLSCLACSMAICRKETYIYYTKNESSIMNSMTSRKHYENLLLVYELMCLWINKSEIHNKKVANLFIDKYWLVLFDKGAKSGLSHRNIYKDIRSKDKRIILLKLYWFGKPDVRQIIRLHYLMPPVIGFYYYSLMRQLADRR